MIPLEFRHFLSCLCLLLLTPLPALSWETWTGCTLIHNEANDGDSFHLRHHGKEVIVRLYFVDCPEADKSNVGGRKRVREQAAHFRRTENEILYLGKVAKEKTARMLTRPFTVKTRGQDAKGNSELGRIYAFVITAEGKDLGEELVRNGLARSYGAESGLPNKKDSEIRERYDRIESQARQQSLGGWASHLQRTAQSASAENEEKSITHKKPSSLSAGDELNILGPNLGGMESALDLAD